MLISSTICLSVLFIPNSPKRVWALPDFRIDPTCCVTNNSLISGNPAFRLSGNLSGYLITRCTNDQYTDWGAPICSALPDRLPDSTGGLRE